MKLARCLWLTALLLGTASATLAADDPFISIFAGYSDNDVDTGADSTAPFGFRIGSETPVAGGQLAVTFNRDGDVKMDTIMADLLLHFGASDARTRRNRILYNRVSGFGIIGLGAMRYDAGVPGVSKATILSWELGLGMQVKFTQRVGMRIQVQSLWTGPNSFNNYSADLGVAIYF
jgi:hypothetical protein